MDLAVSGVSGGEVIGSDWRNGLPLLRGELVSLRELRASDAASLFALLTVEEVVPKGRVPVRPSPVIH